jgi:two-component system cell cycle sensor histidine kinase/response regulator CckA
MTDEHADEVLETEASQPAAKAGRMAKPLTRAVFWTASLAALAAAAVAIIAGAGAGWHGVVLLSGIASAALLLMYALAAGEAAGRSMAKDEEPAPGGLASAALEGLSDPVLITGPTGAGRFANAAYRKLAKAAPGGSGLSLPAPERLFSGTAAGAIYRLSRAAAAGEPARELVGRIEFGAGEGEVYAAEVSPMPGGGAVWRFARAVEEGEASDPLAPDWADHAPVGLFLVDAEGRVLAANQRLRDWLGVEPAAALKLSDILAGDGAGAVTRSRTAGVMQRLDARLIGREGVESPVVVAVDWTDERPARARGVIYGLSAAGAPPGVAQLAEASGGADKPGRTFDDMFSAAPFGVARLDGADPLSAVVEDANPALVQLSGGSAVPGARFAELFEAGEGLSAAFETALAGRGEPGEAELKTDEGLRPVHVFLGPARAGKRAAYLVDITAWKTLENQVSQSSKMQAVGQLASGVAHDFNNMLTAIRLNVGELLNRHPVGDPSYTDLQQINSVVTRQAGLVKKLLAFSRKQTFRLTVFDLSDVLSDCSVMLGQILEETVKLEIRHGRDLPLVRADRHQIDNILVNLATNARDAMRPNGGTLTITTEALDEAAVARAGAPDPKAGRWAAIHISDTGCGMDEATRAKIFEPFFTTKAAGEGTGLGLATVYGIVKQTGGYLFVDSAPGEGTTFRIYLPEHIPSEQEVEEIKAEEKAKSAPVKPSDLAGHGRILLVEDEDAVRAFAAKSLKRRGYEVVEARDGEHALEILEDEPESFDILISDVVMPGLDGPSLLKEARQYLGRARIVFMSGYAEEEFSDTLSSDLDISFLPKPFDIQQLAERVKQEMAHVQA